MFRIEALFYIFSYLVFFSFLSCIIIAFLIFSKISNLSSFIRSFLLFISNFAMANVNPGPKSLLNSMQGYVINGGDVSRNSSMFPKALRAFFN